MRVCVRAMYTVQTHTRANTQHAGVNVDVWYVDVPTPGLGLGSVYL